jgi:hypothetical protein
MKKDGQQVKLCLLIEIKATSNSKATFIRSMIQILDDWLGMVISIFGTSDKVSIRTGHVDCSDLDDLKTKKAIHNLKYDKQYHFSDK